jgi:hypothetical protein
VTSGTHPKHRGIHVTPYPRGRPPIPYPPVVVWMGGGGGEVGGWGEVCMPGPAAQISGLFQKHFV